MILRPPRRGELALALGLAAAGLGVNALNPPAAVPFHPDESSYLFMSRDFAAVFLAGRPDTLAWRPGQPENAATVYRLRDAPLTRYLPGLGWWLAGFTPADLNQDWVWPDSAADNVAAGRVPTPAVLAAGRAPAVWLTALTALIVGGLGWRLRGPGAGLLAGLLMLTSPLLLLHGRRAMAEGPLLGFSALAVAGGVWLAERPGRPGVRGLALGLLAGLALAAKQSALALLPAVFAPAALTLWHSAPSLRRRGLDLAALTLGLAAGAAGLYFALSPALWATPLEALRASLDLRLALAAAQTQGLEQLAPGQVLAGPLDRLRAAVLALYVQPPAVWDVAVANHLPYLAPQAEAYFQRPFSQTPPLLGAALAGLTAAGLAFSALRLWRDRLGPATRAEQAMWAWLAATLVFILWAAPLDWQRYFLPLWPPAGLFAALGAADLAAPLLQRRRPTKGWQP